jgi:hypothetical protein
VSAWAAGRADSVAGRALSPRAFRHFGVEAVVLGPAVEQEGLLRREGIAIWRRLEAHAPLFDRISGREGAAGGRVVGAAGDGLLAVRVVVAITPGRDRAMWVPALGECAARAEAAATGPPPPSGWLLLVDEGPGETWLYLAEEREPAAVLAGFLGRRGRTDFARARRRSGVGSLASTGIFAGLLLVVYGRADSLGVVGHALGQTLGAALVAVSVAALVQARPR